MSNLVITSYIFFTLVFLPMSVGGKGDSTRGDLNRACELSHKIRKLSKLKIYKNDPSSLNTRILREFKKEIKTDDLMKLANTIGLVDQSAREIIWERTAKDLGYDDWKCPGIGEFL